jgi:hypothetical protein
VGRACATFGGGEAIIAVAGIDLLVNAIPLDSTKRWLDRGSGRRSYWGQEKVTEERRSSKQAPDVPERVLLLDAELEAPTPALHIEDFVAEGVERRQAAKATPPAAAKARRRKNAAQSQPATRGRPSVPVTGVELGSVATEILDPFVRAIEVLLRGLADSLGEEAGGPATVVFGSTVIEYSSPGWGDDVVRVYRTGSAPPGSPSGTGRVTDTGRRPRDRWEMGSSAAREGDHASALRLFEEEAKEAEANGVSQRAAIAYRSASREAGLVGRRDYANMLLRLAGKHYLNVAEDMHTSNRGKVQALVTAAKCFLQAGNLPLAASCIARATSAGEALGESPGEEPGVVA